MVATVLTVYGIETQFPIDLNNFIGVVATVLTVYGIETNNCWRRSLTVAELQQYLPFTVLKLWFRYYSWFAFTVATVLTVYGIETNDAIDFVWHVLSCNSTYRLRY